MKYIKIVKILQRYLDYREGNETDFNVEVLSEFNVKYQTNFAKKYVLACHLFIYF